MLQNSDFVIPNLGECAIPSPITRGGFVEEGAGVLYHSDPRELKPFLDKGMELPSFEAAGAREKIYFNPRDTSCGIVTCGGLCPGLNDVIRAVVMSLYYHYGVRKIFGFRYGYEGLSSTYGHKPMELNPQSVVQIHEMGGTVLGSSRGGQDPAEMVNTLKTMNINILFTLGGDGTLRGAHAVYQEAKKQHLPISVIAIPKTIDNDISYIQKSFGFETAVSEAKRATYAAHSEAIGARNGIGLVKLMGRASGFISAYAVLAGSDVNFCLIPEAPFTLMGFLTALKERLERRKHAVIVVAEGAGQELVQTNSERDASGNVRFGDVGFFLKESIKKYFKDMGMESSIKYIDPSYMIRSMPANAHDSAFCLLLGHNAVHAGMAGRTGMAVGFWNSRFTHVPIPLAVSRRKKIDPQGWIWNSVLASTGQPREM